MGWWERWGIRVRTCVIGSNNASMWDGVGVVLPSRNAFTISPIPPGLSLSACMACSTSHVLFGLCASGILFCFVLSGGSLFLDQRKKIAPSNLKLSQLSQWNTVWRVTAFWSWRCPGRASDLQFVVPHRTNSRASWLLGYPRLIISWQGRQTHSARMAEEDA